MIHHNYSNNANIRLFKNLLLVIKMYYIDSNALENGIYNLNIYLLIHYFFISINFVFQLSLKN